MLNACPPLSGTTWRTATLQDEVRAARAELEAVLDFWGWRWSRGLSLRIDALLVLEEAGLR